MEIYFGFKTSTSMAVMEDHLLTIKQWAEVETAGRLSPHLPAKSSSRSARNCYMRLRAGFNIDNVRERLTALGVRFVEEKLERHTQ